MQLRSFHVFSLVGFLAMSGCVSPDFDPELAQYVDARMSRVPMEWFTGETYIEIPQAGETIENSSSTLVRTRTEAWASIDFPSVNLIDPGYTVTVWGATFAKPGVCITPFECTPVDFGDPRTDASLSFFRGGGKVDDSGHTYLTALPLGIRQTEYVRIGNGVVDPMNDEFHVLVRVHGPINEQYFVEQTTSYIGGCTISGFPGADFICYNPIIAEHRKSYAVRATVSEKTAEWTGVTEDGPVTDSRSVMARSELGVMAYVNTGGLPPDEQVVLWWATFNSPENCAGGAGQCELADLDDPAAGGSIIDARVGNFSDSEGNVTISTQPLQSDAEVISGPGIIDVELAEILMVVQVQGPASLTQRQDRQFRYDPECATSPQCFDMQFVRHPPTSIFE